MFCTHRCHYQANSPVSLSSGKSQKIKIFVENRLGLLRKDRWPKICLCNCRNSFAGDCPFLPMQRHIQRDRRQRPNARGLVQHGGPLGWLEESVPAGVILYVMDGPYRLLFPNHTGCPDRSCPAVSWWNFKLLLYSRCTQPSLMSYITQGRHGWYPSRPTPSLWFQQSAGATPLYTVKKSSWVFRLQPGCH
jgi:hypothetical protein